jgi:hypothetical protein
MRILGAETELALGFRREDPAAPPPTQLQIFEALRDALFVEYRSCDAIYYKGGSFLHDGSLLHFEVSQVEDPNRGLLEWATPECAGPREAAAYLQAQEGALQAALPRAEAALAEQGFVGRVVLLKNTEDREGNAYGAHESYSVSERPFTPRQRVFAWILHPLMLIVLALGFLAYTIPLFVLFGVCLILYALVALPAEIPGLGAPFAALKLGMERVGTFLVEPGPRFGEGLLARGFVILARGGGWLFSATASRALFGGHLPALAPFLATRPLFAGCGHLDARGRYHLTPRAAITRRVAAAFVIGDWRPMVDLKEFLFRNPLRYLRRRKRLHLVVGDANRCEHALWLKLATTDAVLDAVEAGALDDLVAGLVLPVGAVGAFARASSDPTLRAAVARDRATGQPLTALDVQRRYLEAVWRHERGRGEPQAERRETLLAWDAALTTLSSDPTRATDAYDWVRKLGLLNATLARAWPALSGAEGWARLEAWGSANALVEELCPEWSPKPDAIPAPGELEARLGPRGAHRFQAAARGLALAEWSTARAAWLSLKAADLAYHELDPLGPWTTLAEREPLRPLLTPAELLGARESAPPRTRAALRGWALGLVQPEGGTLRLGWEEIEAKPKIGAAVVVAILDAEQAQIDPQDAALVAAVLGWTSPSPSAPADSGPADLGGASGPSP